MRTIEGMRHTPRLLIAAAAVAATVMFATPAVAATPADGDANAATIGPCLTPGKLGDLDYPDILSAERVSPTGGWFRAQGAPGGYLCLRTDGGVRSVPFGKDGLTAPIFLTWGAHEVFQTTGRVRSTDVVVNLDCWDAACRP